MNKAKPYLIAGGLALLVAATRSNHASGLLPDASLAAFFLAGIFCSRLVFPLLLLVAGLGDYFALAGGTSDWCMSPAYWFLIPTYASLWLSGRWLSTHGGLQNPLLALPALALSSTAAFLISNYSFYFFSGRLIGTTLAEYSLGILKYYQPYVGSAFLYVAALMLVMLPAARKSARA